MDRWSAVRSRLPRLDPLVTDGLLALVAAGFSLAQMQGFASPRDRSTLNIALVLLQTLSLVLRRRAPFTVFAVAAASAGVQGALGLRSSLFGFLALNLALSSLAVYGDHRLAVRAVTVWASLLTVRLGYLIATRWPQVTISRLSDVVDGYVLLAAAWILGEGSGSGVCTPPSWRTGPPGWSGNGTRRPGRRRPRSACGSPASCTTWSPTA